MNFYFYAYMRFCCYGYGARLGDPLGCRNYSIVRTSRKEISRCKEAAKKIQKTKKIIFFLCLIFTSPFSFNLFLLILYNYHLPSVYQKTGASPHCKVSWHITSQQRGHLKSDPGNGKVQRKLEESDLRSPRSSSSKNHESCCH